MPGTDRRVMGSKGEAGLGKDKGVSHMKTRIKFKTNWRLRRTQRGRKRKIRK